MATSHTHQSTSESGTRRRIVILMGATGTGKSTFISNVLGENIGVGHSLQSCTKKIQEFETPVGDEMAFLVDTPGFDDSDVPDIVILNRISDWLKKKTMGSVIAGVIYLHKISDPRMSGSVQRNLKTFRALCGDEYSPQIVIVTTHWADKGHKRYTDQESRESTFKDTWWNELLSKGAHTDRLEFSSSDRPFPGNTIDPDDARRIFRTVLNIKGGSNELLMRSEVVDQKKKVHKTTAGHVVEDSITERISALDEERKQLKQLKDDVAADQLEDIKDEVRLLKLNRAKLRGNLFGMIRYGL